MKIVVAKRALIGGSILILLQSCLADIRPSYVKKSGITEANISKGKLILNEAWKKQGFDKLEDHQVYSFEGVDIWKKLLGKVGKPWPNAKSKIDFKYSVGTFDGQVTFRDGKREGDQAGLQSWNYYEKEKDARLQFRKKRKRIVFGIAAYQYFVEMMDRLKNVPIISYAGTKSFNGSDYDMVFATWHKEKAHRSNDQYVLWINKKTGILDYVIYTLRESYLKAPGAGLFYGSIHYSDYKMIEGINIPHTQTVYSNKPKKTHNKSLHQMKISNFQFDNFAITDLYPDSSIEKIGDHKLK